MARPSSGVGKRVTGLVGNIDPMLTRDQGNTLYNSHGQWQFGTTNPGSNTHGGYSPDLSEVISNASAKALAVNRHFIQIKMIANQRATEIEKLQETLASKTKENNQLTKENDHLNVEVKTLKEALGLFAKDYHNRQGGASSGFNWNGIPVDKSVIAEMSRKARMLWRTLDKNGLAPETFSKIENRAWDYFSQTILADKAHEFLLLCDDREWKLREWSTKSYPSCSDEDKNDLCKQALDDPKLICMNSHDNSQDEDDDDPSEGEPHSKDCDNDDPDEHTKSVDDPNSDTEGGSDDPEAGNSEQHAQNGDNDAGAKEDGPITGGTQSAPMLPVGPCSHTVHLSPSHPFCGHQQCSKVHKHPNASNNNWILSQAEMDKDTPTLAPATHETTMTNGTDPTCVAKIGKKRKPEGSNTVATTNKQQKVSNVLAIPTEGNSIRNICMRHWNKEQPGGHGPLLEFDVYFKSLSDADKEPFKKEQRIAQATVRKAKKKASDTPSAN
ncbi:hypothetical protein EDB85DRAFT_1890359 [Lactarius pseudohatsudake]|nr:hypothetical protein EDB85DRAFT_1890359 [Lactarius pseudohatsudake]